MPSDNSSKIKTTVQSKNEKEKEEETDEKRHTKHEEFASASNVEKYLPGQNDSVIRQPLGRPPTSDFSVIFLDVNTSFTSFSLSSIILIFSYYFHLI